MPNLSLVVRQLKKEKLRAQEEVERLDSAIRALGDWTRSEKRTRVRRTMSVAARRRIAAAQRARWAKWKASQGKKAA